MGPTAEDLKARLKVSLADVLARPDARAGSGPDFLTVSAADPVVGDLYVRVEDEQITVGIKLCHVHFDQWCYPIDNVHDPEAVVVGLVDGAAQFVQAILADRVLIAPEWEDGVLCGCWMSEFDPADKDRRAALEVGAGQIFYVWSGRLQDRG